MESAGGYEPPNAGSIPAGGTILKDKYAERYISRLRSYMLDNLASKTNGDNTNRSRQNT